MKQRIEKLIIYRGFIGIFDLFGTLMLLRKKEPF